MGILMGLILPAGFILVVVKFETALGQDIERVHSPVAGISPHSKYENNLVVPVSLQLQAFRGLRSNLSFIKTPAPGKAQRLL